MSIVPSRIRKIMQLKGINQTELARASGLSQSMISKILSGERGRNLSHLTMCAIARVLETTPEALMGEEEAKSDNITEVRDMPISDLEICSEFGESAKYKNRLKKAELEGYGKKENLLFERNILQDVALTLRVIHLSAIHAIREFAVKGGFGVVVKSEYPLKPYQELANACRSALAATLKCPPSMFHCTISYCGGSTQGKPTSQRKVWNFAHSEIDCDRNLLLGPDDATIVSKNSSYAALLGCSDRYNEWKHRFRRFTCDNLPEDIYDDADPNWNKWYRSRLVFPLRYQTHDKRGLPIDNITGFLSYDTIHRDIFGVPSIFDYMDNPAGYANEYKGLAVCNVGGIIADCISIAILQEKKFRSYRAIAQKKVFNKED